jgi:hypothetical protein
MSDVASEIMRHQERVRAIASGLLDGSRVRAAAGVVVLPAPDLGGALVHDETHRAVVSDPVGAIVPSLDGRTDLATLVRGSGGPQGEIVEGLAMLIAAGLAEASD